ncbi:MAG: Lrp/AsnC ligand binding domain-containing protein [Candidatus Bathyarchaeia archaeon]
MISACVLIRSERGKFDEVVKKISQFKETKRAFAVLGRFDVVVDLEAPDFQSLGNVIVKMGNMSGVVFTETLVELQRK